MRRLLLVAALLLPLKLVVVTPTPTCAQRADTVRVPAEEGVALFTIVHLPDGPGPHPVVLARNPYRTRGGPMTWLAERLVPHGYAVVEQDVRGTGASPGQFVPFRYDVADGTATLDWLASEPWAGPVALWGISYLGWAAYALAETGHPTIAAMVVGSSWADMGQFLSPGGAFSLQASLTWLLGFGGGGGATIPRGAVLDSLFQVLPLGQLMTNAAPLVAMLEPYRWQAVDVPVLHFTGWFDMVYPHSLLGYNELRARSGPAGRQRLIVGPWAHNDELSGRTRVGDVDFGPAAVAGVDSVAAWTRRFLDVHLQGRPATDSPARVFVLGENGWRSFEDWPPPDARIQAWYLAPPRRGDAREPGVASRLEARPAWRRGATAFRYDPNDPIPTLGGANSHFFPQTLGPLDQRPLDGREDLVSFLTPALDRPLVLAGPVRAVLHIEADAPSTDVAVKLVAVTPDGMARLVEDGIRRVERLEPGVNQVAVELGERAQRFEPGTRLRLDITGGNFPKYDRNPNTGEDAWEATSLQPVRITVHHGRRTPSRLELTVLP